MHCNSILVDRQAFIFADGAIFAAYGRGLINKIKYLYKNLEVKEGRGLIFEGGLFLEEYSILKVPN